MEVDEAEERLVVVLEVDPAPDRTDVVAQVGLTRGLDAAENSLFRGQINLYLYV